MGVFEEINESSYNHRRTRIAASEGSILWLFGWFFISDNILALGSDNLHKKAEILRTDGNTWSTTGDYPDSLVKDIN